MDWIESMFIVVSFVILELIFKYALPSYAGEKGKNIATKQDIAEITRRTESVVDLFKRDFEVFSNINRIKYEYTYKRLSDLYAHIYSFVCQSEYFRHISSFDNEQFSSFEEYPYFSFTHRKHTSRTTSDGAESNDEELLSTITQMSKKELVEFIIEKGQLASPKLLKLAINYRFAEEKYAGGKYPCSDTKQLELFNREELRLIRDLVMCIIQEYNEMLKQLNLEYDENELNTGLFSHEN